MYCARADWTLPAGLIAGVLAAHQFSSLPPCWLILAAVAAALFLAFVRHTRFLAIMVLACCWTLWHFAQQLDDRLDPVLSGTVMTVEGVVSGIPELHPEYTRFRFTPAAVAGRQLLPGALLVYWYRDRPVLSVGERWRLELQLRPPWGRVNFQGPDREKWLFSSGIGALATVRDGVPLAQAAGLQYPLQRLRSQVRDRIAILVRNERARGVVQALSIAERSGLSFSDRQLLMSTGTSHLLAISGLHIGLAAVGGVWFSRLLFSLLPFSWFSLLGLRTSLACGLVVAIAYAGLAGWGVSTQRAVLMIVAAMVALVLSRTINPSRAYLLALCAVLLIDPLAPLGAGFWFSFLAVAVLLLLFVPRNGRTAWWKTVLLAQAGVMIAMLPASAYWFQFFSPVGFLANIVAIPWVSLTVVPLTLAGVSLLLFSDGAAGLLLSLAGEASLLLLLFLEFLSRLQGSLPALPPPVIPVLLLASLGGLLMLLPGGLSLRWLGPFLIVPLMLPQSERSEKGSLLLEVLDAGQGTALLLSTQDRTLLYDSGPGDGKQQNLVSAVISPALARLGRSAPERIVISHGDLDHAGGISGLALRYPGAHWNVNLPVQAHSYQECRSGLGWTWNEFEFEAIHPSSGLPYLGNDSSCVLSVRGKAGSVLLTGDISSAVENRLQKTHLGRHRVLLVPHHGSLTSSGEDFIAAVRPEVAIATAGLGNRFGFPREEIIQRYTDAGTQFWSTGECGALRVHIAADGLIHASSARRQRNRIWRWPAAVQCP
jgi:competence protein ComEC